MAAVAEVEPIASYEDLGHVMIDIRDMSPWEPVDIPWEHFDHRPRTGAEEMDEKLADMISDDDVLGPVILSQQLKRLIVEDIDVVPIEHAIPVTSDPLLQPVGNGVNVDVGK